MTVKTAAGLAFAAASIASFAGIHGAGAQMAPSPGPVPGYYAPQTSPGYYGPQTYPGYYAAPSYQGSAVQGNSYPNWPYSGNSPAPYAAGGPTQVVTNGPQTSPGDTSPSWSPRRNVAESTDYDRLLETNPAFRNARMRKECGPITDPTLRANCEASFGRYEPAGAGVTGYGSSAGSGQNRSSYGR
jgi:hypothetical protein